MQLRCLEDGWKFGDPLPRHVACGLVWNRFTQWRAVGETLCHPGVQAAPGRCALPLSLSLELLREKSDWTAGGRI